MIEYLHSVAAENDVCIAQGTIIVEIAGQIKCQVTPAGIVPQGAIIVQPVGYIEDGIRVLIILQQGVIVHDADHHVIASRIAGEPGFINGQIGQFAFIGNIECGCAVSLDHCVFQFI